MTANQTTTASHATYSLLGQVAMRKYRINESGCMVRENIWDFRKFPLHYSAADPGLPSAVAEFGSEEEMLYSMSHYDPAQAEIFRSAVSGRLGDAGA
jgi:hypothetical protein